MDRRHGCHVARATASCFFLFPDAEKTIAGLVHAQPLTRMLATEPSAIGAAISYLEAGRTILSAFSPRPGSRSASLPCCCGSHRGASLPAILVTGYGSRAPRGIRCSANPSQARYRRRFCGNNYKDMELKKVRADSSFEFPAGTFCEFDDFLSHLPTGTDLRSSCNAEFNQVVTSCRRPVPAPQP